MSQIKALSANERSRAKMLLFQNFHNRKLGILSDNARTKERLFVRQQVRWMHLPCPPGLLS
jgi:hypothetical protein